MGRKVDNRLVITAAVLGRSNMGFGRPEWQRLVGLMDNAHLTLNYAVDELCMEFYEGEEVQKAFQEEADAWMQRVHTVGLETAQKRWPDVFALMEQAEAVTQ